MKLIKRKFLNSLFSLNLILTLVLLGVSIAFTIIANAQPNAQPVEPITDSYGLEVATPPLLKGKEVDLYGIIAHTIKTLLGVLGVIFMVLIVWAGLQWMTAGGNEERIKKAKSLITNAVIGLIIVMAAYALTYFVISQLWPHFGSSG